MFKLKCLAFCILSYFALSESASAPFVKPCKPNDHACIKASSLAALPFMLEGVKELGIPAADPITLNDVRTDNQDLKLGFKKLAVTGINKCKLLDVTRDLEKSAITLVLECPIRATGQYSLQGKLALISVEGEGDFVIETNKVKIEATIKIKDVESGGEKHWKITGFDYSYDIIEKASIDLKNLFGGDDKRAKPIREILDKSWKELITELGNPIIKELVRKQVESVQKLFKAVPVSALELPL